MNNLKVSFFVFLLLLNIACHSPKAEKSILAQRCGGNETIPFIQIPEAIATNLPLEII